MTKAYSYRRFSSPEQAKGRSKDRQLELCEAYCAEHGLELATGKDHTFLDAGKSGYSGEHLNEETGQLARFIRLVEDGSIAVGSYLIVESLDRLGRDHVKDALTRFMSLLAAGINIVTLTDRKLFTKDYTPMDLMMSVVVMARAHEESSTKAMRLGDAFRKKQRDAREFNKPMGAAIPLWLKLEDGRYQLVEEQAKTVRRIFEMSVAGHGKIVTAKALNADGILSPKGTSWGTSSVDKVLHNRAVLGEYQPFTTQGGDGKRRPHGAPILGYYPPVVGEETFYLAQAAMDDRRIQKSTKQTKNFNIWAGIIKCAYCGKALHLVDKGKPPKGAKYLRCSNSAKGMCKAKVVRLDQSEAVFRQMLVRVESQALVQDNAIKIEKDFGVVSGKLSEKRELLGQYRDALQRRYSETVDDLAFACEQEVRTLDSESIRLKALLAAERILSHKDFLQRVDLESYEGRSRANALLKRMEYQVLYGVGYFVTQGGVPQFALAYRDGRIGHIGCGDAEGYDGNGEELTTQLLRMMAYETPLVLTQT